MAGLFDFLTNEDPNQAAQLALAAGLLGGRGSFNEIVGKSLLGAQAEGQRAGAIKRQADLDKLAKQRFQLALDEEERKKKEYQALEQFRASIPSPELAGIQGALSGGGGPTMANAALIPTVDTNAKLTYGAMKAGALSPLDYLRLQQKDTTPIKLGRDERLITSGGKEIVGAAPEKDPESIRTLKLIYGEGTPQYLQALSALGAKATSHPPATNIKIDNKLGEGLAKEVGPMIADSAQRAQGALQQISNADTIIRAVDSNKLYAGPGASLRLKGAQIGQLLGVGGRDAAEIVANTRSVIQGLARATVAARGALRGQGQVSDFEGKLLSKAESGDIEDMTPSEIRYIASKNKEYGTKLIEQHNQLIKKAKSNPATAGVADFFDVQQPSQVLDWGALPGGR